MTKKNFIIIARVINELIKEKALCMDNEDDQNRLIMKFVKELRLTNEKFDQEIFIKECLK